MKITVISAVLHERSFLAAGTVADVDDATATNWIERGIAESHAEPTPEPERLLEATVAPEGDPAHMPWSERVTIETTPLPAPSRRGRRPKAKDE